MVKTDLNKDINISFKTFFLINFCFIILKIVNLLNKN
jgi:hypothetical protein